MKTKNRPDIRYSLGDYAQFIDWLTDERDKLQSYVDELNSDIDAFQKFFLTEWDIRPLNDLIEHTNRPKKNGKN